MSTEVAVRQTDLSLNAGQTFFNEKQIAALRQLGVKDATNGDLAVFFHVAARTGLDPFARQIHMIARWTKEGTKQTIQTGIDGYRLIARRAADRTRQALSYDDTLWCGPDGQWLDVWLSERPPAAAKVTVYRGKARYSAVAVWREFVQTNKDGTVSPMWARMSANQLAKCAEAAVLRKAFPQDLSGIYTEDEMGTDIDVIDQPPPLTETPRVTRMSRAKPAPVEPDLAPPIIGDHAPATAPAAVPKMTAKQRGQMFALLAQLGHGGKSDEERAARLQFIGDILGIDVETTSDLDDEQAAVLIEVLHQKVEASGDSDA